MNGSNRYNHVRKWISGGAKHAYGPMHKLFNRWERRHDDILPPVIKTRAKKDRKRWCGGHEGREHRPVWVQVGGILGHLEFECNTCGKVLDYFFSRWSRGDKYKKPKVGSTEPLQLCKEPDSQATN